MNDGRVIVATGRDRVLAIRLLIRPIRLICPMRLENEDEYDQRAHP
jgi:hypothetical protein